MNNIVKFILSLLIPLVVGFTSGFFTETGEGTWFQTIQKPLWNPPSWVFAPVWTTLYILMGIALYFIWKTPPGNIRRKAILFFSFQLVLNFSWSFIFFKFQQPGWALAEMIMLWLAILVTIFSFAAINKMAAWLLVPYISWVSFAMILNYTIWMMNR